MRGRAAPPHPGIYRGPPPPPGEEHNNNHGLPAKSPGNYSAFRMKLLNGYRYVPF